LMVVIMTLVLGAIPLGLFYAATYAATRLPARLWRKAAPAAPAEGPGMTRRQVVESVAGAAFFGATGSMLGWGMIHGRHAFTLEEVPLRIPGLPRALDGYVIAQVSDLHGGVLVGERELDEGFALVRRARPDLVVVTGDMVDFDAAFAPMVA